MKKVLHTFGEPKDEKGVEFTHHLDINSGWKKTTTRPSVFKSISYLGKCTEDGAMFACVSSTGYISIYKGHLNNGTY